MIAPAFATKPDNLVLAILFNCAKPEAITIALKKIRSDDILTQLLADAGVVLGAYANRLTDVDADWTLAQSEDAQPFRHDLDKKEYWNFIQLWTDKYGVKIVGGCCGITPEHIAFIRDTLGKRVIESV
jgi:S-methylmethionine-dependent homocysteine/selenocysteine methylase